MFVHFNICVKSMDSGINRNFLFSVIYQMHRCGRRVNPLLHCSSSNMGLVLVARKSNSNLQALPNNVPALIPSIIWIHYVNYLVLPKDHGCQSRLVCLKRQMKWSYCSCGFFYLFAGYWYFCHLLVTYYS